MIKNRILREVQQGFTLIELIMAIMIMSVMMILSFFCFDAVVQSWNAGIEVSDSMEQADYVMEQIVSGLRSACYPNAGIQSDQYGLQFEDGGEGEDARDSLSWTKIGRAMVGERGQLAEVPHRVHLYVEEGEPEDGGGLVVKVWRAALQLDDFEPEEEVEPFVLAPRVMAMNCRILKEPSGVNDKEIKWEDTWEMSNAIPYKVSITLYLRPAKERDEPWAVTRDIEIPLWDISQNPVSQESSGLKTGDGQTPTDGSQPQTGTSGASRSRGQSSAGDKGLPIPPSQGGGGGVGPAVGF